MRKILMVLAFAGLSMVSFAQEEVPTKKYSVATNSFWSNWFVQAGIDWNAWYSGQEHGADLKASPFKDFRANPGVAVAIGKWFTPGLGLRVKVQGIWGKRVGNTNIHTSAVDNGNKYWIAQGQAMFNLTNMFLGYSENRLVDIIPFVGAGVGRTMSHNLYATGLSAGLQASFRLSKLLRVYGEAGWNRYEGDIDGFDQYYGNRGWDSHDNNLYVELGLQINLGKSGWEKTPDIDALNAQHQAALDALNSRLRDAEAENARLREALANQKPVETISESVKELISTPISVFFDLNKINIASQKDLVNVRALAKYAVSNNSNLLVTGYADSATGTPKRNQWLSEQRAKTLADELVNMGIDSNKITQVGKGGVETLTPISFNRRATVQVTD
ncbi:OmpA family protein [Prevotella nigrescens]|uniref:OmpA family protein n=1 Tax=Prevotella nigrescens TaxID=28133 RepID=UPI0009DA8AF5|nr:OmpA family protein [Prevotella nigrescens]UAK28915.1 OmpA family protein [Prevotella nigrescens]WMS21961.1 OmpA family protein [Prevotella nigrescens]SUB93670.1 PG33 [Prevotella nigrescens]